MASRKPSRAKNYSRRSVLRSIATGGAVIAGSTVSLPSVNAETIGTPSVPNQFDTDAWERHDFEEKSGGGFTWNGVALHNAELADTVESEIGYTDPSWRLYSWKMDAPLEEYADGGTNNEDEDWWPWWDSDPISLGVSAVLTASVELSNLGDDSDGVTTERGKKALSIYGDQVESDYPFSSVTSCEGLNKDEVGDCGYPTGISFNNPTADNIEEKYTIGGEHSTDDFKVDYRGLFVLQTFTGGESFVISGAVFPDTEVKRGLTKFDYEFDEDFVDTSRAFIKSAGSPQ